MASIDGGVDMAVDRGLLIGNLASPARPLVDPAGRLVATDPCWALDWWVGADDRWHQPAHEAAVRQGLVADAPVVETAMRVPGGDVVHRAYAATGPEGAFVVIEIENQTPVPVAIALVVTPLGEGIGPTEVDLYGATVCIEGHPALIFEKLPARHAGGTDEAALVDVVTSGAAAVQWPGPVVSPAGDARAAFVFPLPHTAVLRAVIPLPAGDERQEAPGSSQTVRFPPVIPAAAAVAKGWEAQGGRGVRVELPDDRIARAIDAARRSLLLADTGIGLLHDDHRRGWAGASVIVSAFAEFGFTDEAARTIATLPEAIGRLGDIADTGRIDAGGAALVSIGRYLQLTDDRDLAEALVEATVAIALGLHRRRAPRRRDRRSDRLVVGDATTPLLGPVEGASYWDQWWASAGLGAAALVLASSGEQSAAADARADAASIGRAAVAAAIADVERFGALGVQPGIAPDERSATNLIAVSLTAAGFLPDTAVAPWLEVTRRWVAAHSTDADGHVRWSAASGQLSSGDARWTRPALTMLLAQTEMEVGDHAGVARLLTAIRAGGGTVSWPEVLDPVSGVSGAGRSHDLRVTALFLRAARSLLFQEHDDGLVLAPLLPSDWWGQGWEVHDAPTRHGLLSYAVRWHGDRPALLWRVEPFAGSSTAAAGPSPIVLRAPGLDRDWSSKDRDGETLLAPVPLPGAMPAGQLDDGGSFV